MKTKYIAAAVLSAMIINPLSVSAEGKDGVAAVVNGQKITVAEIRDIYNATPQVQSQVSFDDFYARAVEVMVGSVALDQAAKKANIESSAEYKKQMDAVKKEIAGKVYLKQAVESNVTDADVKNTYNEYKNKFTSEKEMSAHHILVDDEATANDIIAKIQNGEKFDELAKKYSKEKNPKLGYFTKKMMLPAFADAAFRMKKGQYSQKPIKTEYGYHVIVVDDIRDSKALSFKDAEPQIKSALAQQAVAGIFSGLIDNAKVEKYQLNGEAAVAKAAAPAVQK